MPKKTPWGQRDMRQKVIALSIIAVSAVLVALAHGDLSARRDDQIRGSKLVWRVLSSNLFGAVGYLAFGRRGPLATGALASGEAAAAG
jgi:hypothetical protein